MVKLTLNSIATIMNDNLPDHIFAEVDETWEDYGAGLKWRTIIVTNLKNDDSYQALSPRQHEDIEAGRFTLEEIQSLIDTAVKLCK